MNFTTNPTVEHDSLVDTVFARDVLTATEAKEDARLPSTQVAIVGDYRGHTLKSGRGRKARGAGQTVVSLDPFARTPIEELPNLAEQLRKLYNEFQEKNVQEQLDALAND